MSEPRYDEARVTRMRAATQDSSIADLVDAAAMARYELETAKKIDAALSDALAERSTVASRSRLIDVELALRALAAAIGDRP